MKKEEWLGQKKWLKKRIKQVGLDKGGRQNTIMKCIIVSRYIDRLTVDETMGRLLFELNIDISYAQYFRLLNKAIKLIDES
jgi:hypothetical protein